MSFFTGYSNTQLAIYQHKSFLISIWPMTPHSQTNFDFSLYNWQGSSNDEFWQKSLLSVGYNDLGSPAEIAPDL